LPAGESVKLFTWHYLYSLIGADLVYSIILGLHDDSFVNRIGL